MRQDFRALLRILAGSCVVCVLVMGVLAAAAFGALDLRVAAALALFGIIGGGIVVSRTLSRGLLTQDDRPDSRT